MTGATRGAGPDPGPTPRRSDPPGRLWLVRHGETEWSRDRRHTSHTDLALTRHGELQAAALAPVFGTLRPALALSSPRRRALRTARLAGLDTVTVEADLVEWDYGNYEGLTIAEIRTKSPSWTIWTGDPQGGETADQVTARADRVLGRARGGLSDGDVVLIGHGHFSRVLAARWLGRPATDGGLFALAPAAPCLLGWEYGAPAVLHWNLVDPTRLVDPGTR